MALTSMNTALTGLNASSQAINVIGDNLANMNTIGFKSGQATFAEIIGGMAGVSPTGNPISLGQGAKFTGIVHNLTTGSINNTGISTDAAINGDGYFVVSTGDGKGYTRGGRFQYDRTGNLLSSDGYRLMGYMATNGVINNTGAIEPIEIRKGQLIPANATTQVRISANLDAGTALNDTYSAPVTIYDTLGGEHEMTVTFKKGAGLTWTWEATIPTADFTAGVAGNTQVGTGSIAFDATGKMTWAGGAVPAVPTLSSSSAFANGANPLNATFNIWDPLTGVATITGAASASAVSQTTQNGNAAGTLEDISIDSDGVIIGQTAGGANVQLAQLALAIFPNREGLQKYNGSTFTAYPGAGEPSIGIPGTGGRASITGSSLEASNVDMAGEFVNLIMAQRSYQANTRIITTSDELYQEAINLKR